MHPGLNLGKYNILEGLVFGLLQALRVVQMWNFDLMLLAETKISDVLYWKNRLGYDVVCSRVSITASGGAHGSMGLVMVERPEGWDIDSTCFYGPSVMRCDIISVSQRNPIIEAYPPPPPRSTLDHLLYLEEALNRFPGRDPIVMGDLNAGVGWMQNPMNHQVSNLLALFVLVDLIGQGCSSSR